MIPTATGLVVILLGVWCQFGSFHRTLVATVVLTLFEAADAADLPALGGASVTPAKLFLLFLLLRVCSLRGGLPQLLAEVSPRRALFAYLLLLLWVVFSGLLLPRLFQGVVEVNSLDRTVIDDGPVPLKPSSGNITQSVYAMGSFVLALCVASLARRPGGYAALLKAFMVLTSLDLAFAVLDLATAATHTGFLLDVIHTGNYAFLTDDEAAGVKRISGSFTEASAFASFSLALLALNLTLFVGRVRSRLTGFHSLGLILFLLLSTSTTAYVGLAVFTLAFATVAFWSLLARGSARAFKILVMMILCGVFIVCAAMLLAPDFATAAWNVFDSSVLRKGESESALARGALNIQAGKIFLGTYGFGAGIGATRTSSYVYLLASNLGVIGFALFCALILGLALLPSRADLTSEEATLVGAARAGVLGSLVPAILAATIFDLGPLFYIYVGVAASGIAAFGTAGQRPAAVALGRA